VRQEAEWYVREIVRAGRDSPALLLWDVMNEPVLRGDDRNGHRAFTAAILRHVRRNDVWHQTTVGMTAFVPNHPGHNALAQIPELDVLSVHPYGAFRDHVETSVDYATSMPTATGGLLEKPVLVTEIGCPGCGQPYADALDYLTNVRWTWHGGEVEGVGFFLFGAMVGWESGNFPHAEKHGIFYWDGSVRHAASCRAIQQVAIAQGIPPSTLTQSFVEKGPLEPGYLAQGPLPAWHDYTQTVADLTIPEATMPSLSDDDVRRIRQVYEALNYDLWQLTLGPRARVLISLQDQLVMSACLEGLRAGHTLGFPHTPTERARMLDLWRDTLISYVWPLGGPRR
jgi:hypothetical protein